MLPCHLIEINNVYKEDYDAHFKKYKENKKQKIKQAADIEAGLTVENIELTLTTYEKLAGKTALCKSTSIYKHSTEALDIEGAGLVNTDFIEFTIADKKQNIDSKAEYTIKQIKNNKTISTKSLKKREEEQRKADIRREREQCKQQKEAENEAIQAHYKELKNKKPT